ncbi:MAG: TIGR04282 family arsenosugar biosynthesis glycosyltransferase [Chitinophagaceae bacterium]
MNHNFKKNALILFARKLELGKVKTRLAATLGEEEALEIYGRLLGHTRTVARVSNCDVHVFLTELIGDDFWIEFNTHQQIGLNLGQKMQHAFELVFELGYEKLIIIGSDCPGITPRHVKNAIESLNKVDVVFGPALDGGYYLMGMKQVLPRLFQEVNWSTSSVLFESLNRVEQAGKTYVLLEPLNDLDEEKDIPEEWR